MFVVTEHSEPSGNRTFIHLEELHLDAATWNWPCVKTGCLRSNPTFLTDCYQDLLKMMHGISTFLPLWSPPNNFTSRIQQVRIACVPLQTPFEGFKLWRIMSGQPIFSLSLERGMPDVTIVLRCSTGYLAVEMSIQCLMIYLSALLGYLSYPERLSMSRLLILSTLSLHQQKIVIHEILQ